MMSDVITVYANNVDNTVSDDVQTRQLLRSLKCPHCHLFFNQTNRRPRRLPGCEHPACHACVFTTLMRSLTPLTCHCGVITESDAIDTAAFPLNETMHDMVAFFMPNDGEISSLDMPRILRNIRSELINNPTFRRSPALASTGSRPSRFSGAADPSLSDSPLFVRAFTSSVDLPESAFSPRRAGDGVTSGDRRPENRSSGARRGEALRAHLRTLLGRQDEERQATSSNSTQENLSASRPSMGSDERQRPYDGRARLGRSGGPSTSQAMIPRSPRIFAGLATGLEDTRPDWLRYPTRGIGSAVGLSRSTDSLVRPNRASTSAGPSSANTSNQSATMERGGNRRADGDRARIDGPSRSAVPQTSESLTSARRERAGDDVPSLPSLDVDSPSLSEFDRLLLVVQNEALESLRAPFSPRSPARARDSTRHGEGTGAENSSCGTPAAVSLPRSSEAAGGSNPAPPSANRPSDNTGNPSSRGLLLSRVRERVAAIDLSRLLADHSSSMARNTSLRGHGNFSSSPLRPDSASFSGDEPRATFERQNRSPSPDLSPVRSTGRETNTGGLGQGSGTFFVRYVNELRRRQALARDLDRNAPIRRSLGGSRIPGRRGAGEDVEFEEYDPTTDQSDAEDDFPFDEFIRSLESWRDRSPVRMPPLQAFTSPVPVLSEGQMGDQCVVCQSGLVEPSPYPSDPPATDDEGKDVIRFCCSHMLHRNCAMSMASAFCAPTSVTRPIGPMQCPLCKRNLY